MELYSWEKHRPKWVNVTASHIWGLSYIPPRKFLANTIFHSMLLAFSMYSNPRKCWLDIPIIPHYIPYFFGSLPILQLYTTPFIAILYIYIYNIYIPIHDIAIFIDFLGPSSSLLRCSAAAAARCPSPASRRARRSRPRGKGTATNDGPWASQRPPGAAFRQSLFVECPWWISQGTT